MIPRGAGGHLQFLWFEGMHPDDVAVRGDYDLLLFFAKVNLVAEFVWEAGVGRGVVVIIRSDGGGDFAHYWKYWEEILN